LRRVVRSPQKYRTLLGSLASLSSFPSLQLSAMADPVALKNTSEVEQALADLRRLLRGLPSQLPLVQFTSDTFKPSLEAIQDYGTEASAVNRCLEVTLAPTGRLDGLTISGRGPALEAVVDVLARLTKENPEDVVFQKWIDDLTQGAKRAGAVRSDSVLSILPIHSHSIRLQPTLLLLRSPMTTTTPLHPPPCPQLRGARRKRATRSSS
jgi:hypothetical protein